LETYEKVYREEMDYVILVDNKVVVNVFRSDNQEVVDLEIDHALVGLFSVVSNILGAIGKVIFFFLSDLVI